MCFAGHALGHTLSRWNMGATAREDTTKPTRRENKRVWLPTKFSPRLWDECDRRIAVVKMIRRRYELLKEHCNGDASYMRDLLCQRAAFISVVLETNEVQAAEGEPFESGAYIQATNALLGLLKTLGLDRHVKSMGDLKTYLEEKDRRAG